VIDAVEEIRYSIKARMLEHLISLYTVMMMMMMMTCYADDVSQSCK